MPTYGYECAECGHEFDAFQAMSDDPLKTCPSCGQDALRRLITGGSGIIFKGSGFYVTDARSSSGKKKTAKSDSDSAAKSEPADTGTTTAPADTKTPPAESAKTGEAKKDTKTPKRPAAAAAK